MVLMEVEVSDEEEEAQQLPYKMDDSFEDKELEADGNTDAKVVFEDAWGWG